MNISERDLKQLDWDSIKNSNGGFLLKARETRAKFIFWWSFTELRDRKLYNNGNGLCHLYRKHIDDQQHVLMAHVMELDVGTDAIGIDVRLNSAAQVGVAGAVRDEDLVPVAHRIDVGVGG